MQVSQGPRALENKLQPEGINGVWKESASTETGNPPNHHSCQPNITPQTCCSHKASLLRPSLPSSVQHSLGSFGQRHRRARPALKIFPPQHTHRAFSASTPFLRIQKPPSPPASSWFGATKRTSLRSAWCVCTWFEPSTCSPKIPMAW